MDEQRPVPHRAAIVFIFLLAVFTLGALYAPSFERPTVLSKVATSVQPVLPAVELWLSTENRKLQLKQQPDIRMGIREPQDADIVIDTKTTFQTMTGFGAAMTDASAWLLQNKLSALQRTALMHDLFGPPPNLNFHMLRLTIGASDFSLQPYTLDDVPFGQTDAELAHFNVTPNLQQDVIPSVREALGVNPALLIVASPWSAPAWMKTSENLIGGELLEQYESVYADYLVKYLDAFRGLGIPIFALTLQNEPSFTPITYPGMEMGADTRARIVAQYLGPKLASRKPRTRILEWDHNWSHPEQPLAVLGNADAARYVDGVAWHCYEGSQYAQGEVHRAFPQKDVYLTECSGGDWASSVNGELIWFTRNLLVLGTKQWARGVIYWNLALDEAHGPHFGGCDLCKGVVTIDSKTGEVTRNDEYYALAHFSRFVLPGAVRVKSTDTDAEKGFANVAFLNEADGSLVLIVVNTHATERRISVAEGPTRFEYAMPGRSVGTFVWYPDRAGSLIRRAFRWLKGR